MKKIYIPITVIVLALISAVTLVACTNNNDDNSTVTAQTNSYKMTVTLNNDLTEATIAETITYCNTSTDTLNTLVMYLYPNAYRKDALYPAYSATPERFGSLSVTEITCGNDSLSYSLSDSAVIMTVSLPNSLESGKSITLNILSTLAIPSGKYRLGSAGNVTNITNFYPILSVYENSAWRQDEFCMIGDPFYSTYASYDALIECPTDVVVACGADEVSEVSNSYKKVVTAKSEYAGDFAFSCSRDFKTLNTTACGIEINYYYTSATPPESGLETAVSAIETFTKTFGNYDGKKYTLVDTDYYFGGMEYPKLVFINKNAVAKEEIIVHETAHQWFACAVGSDSINNSWQDEALVTFLTNYYYSQKMGDEQYNKLKNADLSEYNCFIKSQKATSAAYIPDMQKSIYDFDSMYEYSMLIYTKGSLMFDAVYNFCGEKKMMTALAKYYNDNKGKIATPDDLFNAFGNAGADAKKLCEAWLNNSIVTASFQ